MQRKKRSTTSLIMSKTPFKNSQRKNYSLGDLNAKVGQATKSDDTLKRVIDLLTLYMSEVETKGERNRLNSATRANYVLLTHYQHHRRCLYT